MISKTGIKGFSLIEVMVASCILALGSLLLYQSFFVILDTLDYCSNLISASLEAEELLNDSIVILGHSSEPPRLLESGRLQTLSTRSGNWKLSYALVDSVKKKEASYLLYRILLETNWKQARRQAGLSLTNYALRNEE